MGSHNLLEMDLDALSCRLRNDHEDGLAALVVVRLDGEHEPPLNIAPVRAADHIRVDAGIRHLGIPHATSAPTRQHPPVWI
jgi:hypothetical protein